MKQNRLMIASAVLLATLGATAALTAPAKKPASRAATPYRDQGFAPGFDDLMTMLIQPRHIKLFYAGAAKNWELAAAESRDLRQALDRIAKALPQYEGNDVPRGVDTFIAKKLDGVDAAIAAADPKRFAGAYKDLTGGCNDCHHYMEHPYIVIKVPSGPDTAHLDQDFNPAPLK